MGLAVRGILEGDQVCRFKGSAMPVVIREYNVPFTERGETHKCYELVGLTYVHGLMDGAEEKLPVKLAWQRFYLR